MAASFQGIGVRVEIDQASLARLTSELEGIKGGVDKAINGAVAKTVAKTKTMIIRQLSEDLTAKPSVIRRTPGGTERIVTTPVYGGAASVRVMGRRIGAINFQWRRSTMGVTVTYFRSGGRALFGMRDAFKGTGRPSDKGEGGNVQLFFRTGEPKRRVGNPHYLPNKGKMREPIAALKGLSLFDVYKGNSKWAAEVEKFMQEDIKEQLLSQTDRLLGRSKSARTAE